MEWKPIETAPKDADVLLFGVHEYDGETCWAVGFQPKGEDKYWHPSAISGDEWDFDMKPTHWMPLPNPPA